MSKYAYYENGKAEIFTETKLKELYHTLVDDNQKRQGTTFSTWLVEMENMQILNKI